MLMKKISGFRYFHTAVTKNTLVSLSFLLSWNFSRIELNPQLKEYLWFETELSLCDFSISQCHTLKY